MVDSFATVALETLRDLMIEEAKFLLSVDSQVEEVRRQLQTMHSFLKDADKWADSTSSATVDDWVSQLSELTIQAENVLERYAIQVQYESQRKYLKDRLKRFSCILGKCVNLHQIGNQTQDIRSRMADLSNRAEYITREAVRSSISVDNDVTRSRKTFGYETQQHFVGMKDEMGLLQSLLTSNDRSNRVISICGMGGLGKTTLVTKIYRGDVVERCFPDRAWVCISQQFQIKNVLQDLLMQLVGEEHQIMEMSEDALQRKLLDVQDGKRCLVVVDDIWEVRHWNTLKSFFRVDEDRCRILLTTRDKRIAKEYHVHELNGLSEDEGCELLQKIAFPLNDSQELSSAEVTLLQEFGRPIVRNCGYLPLTISIIGGILRHQTTSSGWEEVCKRTDSYLQHNDDIQENERVTQILDLSYTLLPYNLKACFLYLGCFPEDKEISTQELYLLWMAEGMISSQDKGKEETLRDVAERYLRELANRCMVQLTIDEDSIYNKFKSCRLHDLMRNLCLLKGREKGFVDAEIGRDDVSSVRRLAIHLDKAQDNISEYKKLRSLMFSVKGRIPFRDWNNLVSVNFGRFKYLKILTLQGFKSGHRKLPKGIEKLILLKHLSVQGSQVEKLSSGIFKLPRLQSLDLRTCVYRMVLPNSIHMLRSLRHLFLNPSDREVMGDVKLKLSSLIELETLIGFNSELDDTADIIELPKLRVLDGEINDEDSVSVIVDHILEHQDQFRETGLCISIDGCSTDLLRKTLKCHSLSKLIICCPVDKLPSYGRELGKNLIRLELSSSCISEDPMEMLEKLPELRILVLYKNSFVGKEMVCGANGFLKLKKLTLWGLPNLVLWRVEEKAMPSLSELSVWECDKLGIPEGLKFITTLKIDIDTSLKSSKTR